MIRVLVALLVVACGYALIRTATRGSSPLTPVGDKGNVQYTLSDGTTSEPQTILTYVTDHGDTVFVSSGEADAAQREMADRQRLRAGSRSPQRAPKTADPESPLWSSTKSMSARQNAHAHWVKHGAEFPEYKSASEYWAGARAFFSRPPPGTLKKVRANGDRLFFNPRDGTFGVQNRDGAPRTMFRPDDGIEYWRRQ